MTRPKSAVLILEAMLAVSALAASQVQAPGTLPEPVQKIFTANCLDCHSGKSPAGFMSLEPDKAVAALLDTPSSGKPQFKRVNIQDPAKSYLVMKLKGSEGIAGYRMPQRRKPLKDADLLIITDWVKSQQPGRTVPAS